MRTVLQVPMTNSLKASALKAAKDSGFSSLQETVRVFLNQLVNKQLSISFTPQVIKLSPAAEKRYLKWKKTLNKAKISLLLKMSMT